MPCSGAALQLALAGVEAAGVGQEGHAPGVVGALAAFDPVIAVAWLARKVASFGVRLKAGDIVLPGSCTRAIDARPGDSFHAEFSGLGSVSLQFV